jgi:hypothetical protein
MAGIAQDFARLGSFKVILQVHNYDAIGYRSFSIVTNHPVF